MSASISLRIRNVQCEGCASRVRQTLETLEGVEDVGAIDVGEGLVDLELDEDRTSHEELGAALDQAGFPVVGGSPRRDGQGDAPELSDRSAALRFGVLAVGALVLGVLGYVGYELYPRFDVPAVDGIALLALAAGAGVASFFSPCAFSLLLTIVGREGGGMGRPFRFATGVSLGATVFVLLLGAVMALGGRALVGDVVFTSTEGRVLRAGVGTLLVGLGLVQAGLLPNPLHAVENVVRPLIRLQAEQRRERPFVGSTLFGFGYLLAGFG